MSTLPETINRHWVTIQPLMDSGGLLLRRPEDDLFYVDRAWPGFPQDHIEALVRLGVIRPIGLAYALAPRPLADPTPLEGTYPAITVHQPFATLIAKQAKPWELRHRRPPAAYIGRRVAIHAAQRKINNLEVKNLLVCLATRRAMTACVDPELAVPLLERMLVVPLNVPLGAVVCTAILNAAVPTAELVGQLGWTAPADEGDDAERYGRWAWPLTGIEALPWPVPACGLQGWWKWKAGEDVVR